MATLEPPQCGNRRVDRLLAWAARHQWRIERKVVTYVSIGEQPYWVLTPEPNADGYSLTVTPHPNHACDVMADLPGSRIWEPITQRRAMELIARVHEEQQPEAATN